MAFSFTGDLGCEFGPSTTTSTGIYLQGVGCHGDKRDPNSIGGDNFGPGINPKQSFVGWMLYDRTWFKKDTHAITVGGGMINNPGRYLVLLPPINGETASSAAINAPYFTGNPSDPFKAWDMSVTYDYMPRQWLTFRWGPITATRMCRTGPATAELHHLARPEFLIPTTDIPNTLLAWMGTQHKRPARH